MLIENDSDLDGALASISQLDVNDLDLSTFEKTMVKEAIEFL